MPFVQRGCNTGGARMDIAPGSGFGDIKLKDCRIRLPGANPGKDEGTEKVELIPAHNGSALVAHVPEPEALRYAISALPRENTWAEGMVALLSLTLLFGAVWAGPWLALAFGYAVLVQRSPCAVAALALLLADALLLPAGKEWPAFRHWWLWDTWRRYFRLRLVTPPLPYLHPTKPVLFAHFPHATFPMGSWLSIALCDSPETGLPRGTQAAVASVLLRLPLLRHVWAWMGCVPADYAPLCGLLQTTSVGVVPEGVAGIFLGACKGHERIYARARHGYIRLAMEAGADIVPVYSLGQSRMLDFRGSCALSRRARAAVGVFWGRWGAPVPRRHDIIVAVGRAIPVRAKRDPSAAQVAEAQAAVLAAVEGLFDRHKHLLPGWEGKHLEIV